LSNFLSSVPWGKHSPIYNESYRLTHTAANDEGVDHEAVLPVVTIRDPIPWLASMCRHEYSMEWPHDDGHCPNLVPNQHDVELDPSLNATASVPVAIRYHDQFVQHHASMIHHWNEWYAAYRTASFPRVMVRFEDLIFHPETVTRTVCECFGGRLDVDGPDAQYEKEERHGHHAAPQFVYIVDSAKKGAVHGSTKTGYVDAMIRYGTDRGDRWQNWTADDLQFARQYLDPTLMRMFGYRLPPEQQPEQQQDGSAKR
jgi:hypothetical protein